MNLQQYRRSEVVQGGMVIRSDAALDSVTVADVDGQPVTIVSPGLCAAGAPTLGDQLLLLPNGQTCWISAAEFDAEWEPVRGSILS